MDTRRQLETSANHRIEHAEHTRNFLILFFEDGTELIFSADVLYALPAEFAMVEQVKKLLG